MDYNKIITKNAVKILATFQQEKNEKKLYLNQIYEKTGIKSKNNLIKNLNLLASFNILKKDKRKGNTFYSLNYDNGLCIALLNIINNIRLQNLPFERRKALEEVINEIKPPIAILFGSTAKGDFKKDSDIDLLIVSDNKFKEIPKKISSISSRFGVKINPLIINFEELDKKNEALIHILKTGYPLIGYNYFYNETKKI